MTVRLNNLIYDGTLSQKSVLGSIIIDIVSK